MIRFKSTTKQFVSNRIASIIASQLTSFVSFDTFVENVKQLLANGSIQIKNDLFFII